jgi:hypothetical protein
MERLRRGRTFVEKREAGRVRRSLLSETAADVASLATGLRGRGVSRIEAKVLDCRTFRERQAMGIEMPTFDEAKAALKAAHIEQGFRLIDEHQRELYFAVTERMRLFVSEEEIEEYRSVADQLATLHVSPLETSIVGTTFREQLVQIVGPLSVPIFSRYSFGDRPIRFVNEAGETVILAGPPSPMFVNFFRSRKGQSAFLRERLSGQGQATLKQVFDRLLTIRMDAAEPLS